MRKLPLLVSFYLLPFLLFSSLAQAYEVNTNTPAYKEAQRLKGTASWYGPRFHGRLTANGERYNQFGFTVAHKSMKFGHVLQMKNTDNGLCVLVQVNDRGPYVGKRIFDLSEAAMKTLDGMKKGVINIEAVAVSDNKGVPYDKNCTYYIHCIEKDTLLEASKELEKFHKIGFFKAYIFEHEDCFFVGASYDNFKEAQNSIIDHITLFPRATIELLPKNLVSHPPIY